MGLYAILRRDDGSQICDLPDPAGGRFDAAGDFDALLDQLDHSFPLLAAIDRDAVSVVRPADLRTLQDEVVRLRERATKPVEKRGLDRLLALVELVLARSDLELELVGD